MLSYTPNSEVTVSFDMIHPDTSEALDPVSASVTVYNELGQVMSGPTSVTVTGGETALQVTVAAVDNAIPETEGGRTVVLDVTTAQGTVQLRQTYLLEKVGFLKVPEESGMTLPQSLLMRRSLGQSVLEVLDYAEEKTLQAALREAWIRLTRFSYDPWRPYEQKNADLSDNILRGDFRINELTAGEWAALPVHFTNALKRAQLGRSGRHSGRRPGMGAAAGRPDLQDRR